MKNTGCDVANGSEEAKWEDTESTSKRKPSSSTTTDRHDTIGKKEGVREKER